MLAGREDQRAIVTHRVFRILYCASLAWNPTGEELERSLPNETRLCPAQHRRGLPFGGTIFEGSLEAGLFGYANGGLTGGEQSGLDPANPANESRRIS